MAVSWHIASDGVAILAYLLVPVQLLLGELVGASMVEDGLLQLGPDRLEFLEGGSLGHGGRI